MKADPDLMNIPVIMVTILEEKGMGYALGASEYITKPADWGRLVSVLKKYRRAPAPCEVLVVEDDEATREMLSRMLRKEGWGVSVAENGRAALQRVVECQPALVLLDLLMPEMDGFEFIAELRKNPDWRSIPIVIITGKDLTQEDYERLDSCVEKILQKALYTREELLAEVRDLVAERTGAIRPERVDDRDACS